MSIRINQTENQNEQNFRCHRLDESVMSEQGYLRNSTEKRNVDVWCFLLLYTTYMNSIRLFKVEHISFRIIIVGDQYRHAKSNNTQISPSITI